MADSDSSPLTQKSTPPNSGPVSTLKQKQSATKSLTRKHAKNTKFSSDRHSTSMLPFQRVGSNSDLESMTTVSTLTNDSEKLTDSDSTCISVSSASQYLRNVPHSEVVLNVWKALSRFMHRCRFSIQDFSIFTKNREMMHLLTSEFSHALSMFPVAPVGGVCERETQVILDQILMVVLNQNIDSLFASQPPMETPNLVAIPSQVPCVVPLAFDAPTVFPHPGPAHGQDLPVRQPIFSWSTNYDPSVCNVDQSNHCYGKTDDLMSFYGSQQQESVLEHSHSSQSHPVPDIGVAGGGTAAMNNAMPYLDASNSNFRSELDDMDDLFAAFANDEVFWSSL
jgi:hypothetical protein